VQKELIKKRDLPVHMKLIIPVKSMLNL